MFLLFIATGILFTATPKETKYNLNVYYLGESINTYSLKMRVENGFLAPYNMILIDLDKDLTTKIK